MMTPDEPRMQAVNPETGEPVDLSVLEDTDIAFDPSSQHVDLTKAEKRRTTALMMAIQAYKNLIIPDAAYLTAAADLARRDEGPKIHPATIDAMVVAAIKFDAFIAGAYAMPNDMPTDGVLGRPSDQITDTHD